MKPNLIAKFKAVIIGLVILTTFSLNNITEQTTVNAKAKTVMLQKKKQVKKGNQGKRHQKKHAYSRKKAKKTKPKMPNKKPVNSIKPNTVRQADLVPDLTVNTPKIDAFSADIISKYYLLGCCFAKSKITYGYDNVALVDQQTINEAVKQINNLQIVKLLPAQTNPDITIYMDNKTVQNSLELGMTYYHDLPNGNYKHLNVISSVDIYIHKNTVANQISLGANPKLLINNIALHEIGHALGLAHVPSTINNNAIMNAAVNCLAIPTNDGLHENLDQYYKNGLAILYKN